MLACARIGAPHNVVFGGFSPESVRERMEFSEAKALITVDGARRKGKTAPIKAAGRRGHGRPRRSRRSSSCATPATTCAMEDGRDVWYHELLEAADAECPAEPLDAEHPLFILYSSGSTAKPKGILHTTGGYLTQVACTHKARLRPQAGGGRLLVLGRRRLGHRPLLHRLRAAGQRRDVGDVRGRAGLPGQGHLVGAVRALRRDDLLHGADGDPRLHEVGRGVPGAPRPVQAAAARHGRRADQPEGVALVPQGHRRRALPDRRHLVADRDRRDHDHDAAGRRRARSPGSAGTPLPGIEAAVRRRATARTPAPTQGLLDAAPAVAGDAAHALQGRRPLHRDVLVEVRPDDLPRRRRRPPRRGRLLLDHRAHRRRAQRLRPPHVDGRDRVGDRLAPEGRRGGGDRPGRRGHRPVGRPRS